jgi:hypothetical protein
MKTQTVLSWRGFVTAIDHLRNYETKLKTGDPKTKNSNILFRGQSNSKWLLETTLERAGKKDFPLTAYFNFVSTIKAKIESFTGRNLDIPSKDDYLSWCNQLSWPFPNFLGYEYFAYLRHHGFPSPFLDWTLSPYIAAYFAMINPTKEVNNVAIYAYLESVGIKVTDIQGPTICKLGPFVTTHKRHYVQQSTYTICISARGSNKYTSHENVVNTIPKQDLLWKFKIPTRLRLEFLKELDLMNINSYSLFETEEKLMESIYISEVELGNHL